MKRRLSWRGQLIASFLCGVAILVTFNVSEVNAWPWRRLQRPSVTRTTNSWPTGISSSAQAKAQYKAQLMASRGVLSHGIAPLVATFEGIGCGASAKCGTCTPHGRMTLVADASVFSSRTGRWYRVRGWR